MLRSVMRAKLMILAAAAAAATGGFWPLTADAQPPLQASRGQPSPEEQRRIQYEADRDVVRNQIGTIELQTTPGARVLLDEDAIGAAPLPTEVYVKPGSHTVVVEDKDRKASRSIFVGPGKRVALELTRAEQGVDRGEGCQLACPVQSPPG